MRLFVWFKVTHWNQLDLSVHLITAPGIERNFICNKYYTSWLYALTTATVSGKPKATQSSILHTEYVLNFCTYSLGSGWSDLVDDVFKKTIFRHIRWGPHSPGHSNVMSKDRVNFPSIRQRVLRSSLFHIVSFYNAIRIKYWDEYL